MVKLSNMLAAFAFPAVHGDDVSSNGPYNPAKPSGTYLLQSFEDGSPLLVASKDSKYDGQKFTIGQKEGVVAGIEGDDALYLDKASQFYALTTMLDTPVTPQGKDLVLQYEVRYTEQVECGGAYLKFLDAEQVKDPKQVNNESPYIIMFGPDKCGNDNNKVHFILRHQNPISHEWSEHHFENPPEIKVDRVSHLYTLVLHPDNTFKMLIDNTVVKTGSLLEDMVPPINPPDQIDDPDDIKPSDWVDEAKINDPEASKPNDWDESAPRKIPDPAASKPSNWWDDEEEMVPDPEAEIPEDWDAEEDGEWEPPLVKNPKCSNPGCGEWKHPEIDNPDYKGKWVHPRIDNPEYNGEWAPRKIPNPYVFEDSEPYNIQAIGAVAVEVWTTFKGVSIDNILIADSAENAKQFGAQTFGVKQTAETSKAEDRARAKRHQERLRLLEDGSIWGQVQYHVGEGIEIVRSNPIAAIMTAIAILISIIYACCKCCCSEEEFDDSEEEVPSQLAPELAPTENKKEKEASENNIDAKPTTEGNADANADAEDDTPPDADEPEAIASPEKSEQKAEKKSSKRSRKSKSKRKEKS